MLPVVLALGGLGFIMHRAQRLPPGERPFDAFPIGVDHSAALSKPIDFKASSGKRYRLTTFGMADGGRYAVAEKRGDVDWISFTVDPRGQRTRVYANADKHEEIAEMVADFQLDGGAVT